MAIWGAALLVAAGLASPPPVRAAGQNDPTADSQVRDTPLVAAPHATAARPVMRAPAGGGGHRGKLAAQVPPRPSMALAASVRVRDLLPALPSTSSLGIGSRSPRGPPAT